MAKTKRKNFTREQIFSIYEDIRQNAVIAKDYKTTAYTISEIKRGLTYSRYYDEFIILHQKEIAHPVTELNKVKVEEEDIITTYYYLHFIKNLRQDVLFISSGNILIEVNAHNKTVKLVDNAYLKGNPITYEEALQFLHKNNLLGLYKKSNRWLTKSEK